MLGVSPLQGLVKPIMISGVAGQFVIAGRIKGHVDSIITALPSALGLSCLMLWGCKFMNTKSWADTVKKGVVKSKPIYVVQMAIYQSYMEGSVEGVALNPSF